MSTTATFSSAHAFTSAKSTRPSFFERLVANRTRQAQAHIQTYLVGVSDGALADVGMTAEQIKSFRATGQVPAAFWR
ncbi:MAG: hypothetical protein R3D68_14125 [Hyphomicrobiaceae bacterium]